MLAASKACEEKFRVGTILADPAADTPTVYGEARGAVYYHYDPSNGKLDGPFLPENK
jgi:hypothetical protein